MRDKSFYFKKGPKAVLLFHAFSSTPNDMRTLGRALEREQYSVYAPTFQGHGTNDPGDVLKHGPKNWLRDAEEAFRFLKREGHDVIAPFGLSMGGIMALHLMLHHEVPGGGVFASPVSSKKKTKVPETFWSYYRQKKESEGHSINDIDQQMRQLSPKLTHILKELNSTVEEMESAYQEIKEPVFIAQGGKDEIIDPETALLFRQSLSNSAADFHWYKNGKHALTVGEHSKALQGDLIAFLNHLDWNGGF